MTRIDAEDLDVQLPRHQYSLGVMAGSLALVLHAGTPLRRVGAVLSMSWNWAGIDVFCSRRTLSIAYVLEFSTSRQEKLDVEANAFYA